MLVVVVVVVVVVYFTGGFSFRHPSVSYCQFLHQFYTLSLTHPRVMTLHQSYFKKAATRKEARCHIK